MRYRCLCGIFFYSRDDLYAHRHFCDVHLKTKFKTLFSYTKELIKKCDEVKRTIRIIHREILHEVK